MRTTKKFINFRDDLLLFDWRMLGKIKIIKTVNKMLSEGTNTQHVFVSRSQASSCWNCHKTGLDLSQSFAGN